MKMGTIESNAGVPLLRHVTDYENVFVALELVK